ncbi:MAG: hypothetical protein RBT61_11980, partial [Candidatus Kapabacteria bacterium]|nr:hypothetical protein [Candidatus Kapabacteria bacterium]
MKRVIFFIIILILCSIVNSAGQVKDEWIITDSLNNYLAYFHDIKALDAENIFIAGGIFLSRSSVYVSNDSGKTFSIAFYDSLHISDNSNYTLSIPSEDFIFAAGSYGRYHISTDKGLTWKTDTLEIFGIDMQSYFDIFSSHFWDNKKGIICVWNNYNNYILKTTDAGKNWKEVMQLDSIIGINKSIQGFDSGTTYLISKEVNDNYYLYKSTDFGETWHETLNLPFPLDFKRCIFLNEQVGFMFGANSNPPGRDNFIYKTTDGGKSWNNVYDGYSERGGTIADMSFCDSLNGITAGMSFVLRTEDGGETWYQDTTFHLDKFPSTMRYVYML